MINKEFGQWTVIGLSESSHGKARWRVQCTCNKIQEVYEYDLLHGRSSRCRSCAGAMRVKDKTDERHIPVGTKLGKWVIKEELFEDNRRIYLCRCECGFKSNVSGISLRNGTSTSCGNC